MKTYFFSFIFFKRIFKKLNKFRYKIIISDSKMDKEMIESAWLKYADEWYFSQLSTSED